MNTPSQSENPNPHHHNPNGDQGLPYCANQVLNDSPYLDIANFLMSNEGEGSNESILTEKNESIEDIIDCFDGSSSSTPLAPSRGMKSRREVKKHNTQEDFRLAFRTQTNLEFMDDGYKWRKYGKKLLKNNPYPRNYFKCSSGGCNVKKRVEREKGDPSYVITTYQGMHNHENPICVPYCSSSQPSSLSYISSSI